MSTDYAEYACLNGHMIASKHDLNGCMCPVCMGKIIGWETDIHPFVLSPAQAEVRDK